ncbi:MAG: sigma-70 family RNA polymerase sigma factor [Bryobacterales bacterium]|nr:sigma-70 family RNA polymerase sigma factor [Bryobacterales bacterium]
MNERAHTAAQPVLDRRAAFVDLHLKRIFVLVYRVVGNVADAQDLTQEVFIKALQHEDQLRDADKAAQWLSRIASNTAIDFLRRRGRGPQVALDDGPELSDGSRAANPESLLLRAESHQLFQDALQALTPRERTALVLRDVEGLPAEHVAQALGCSKATVRSHIANARVKFRKFLKRRAGLSAPSTADADAKRPDAARPEGGEA